MCIRRAALAAMLLLLAGQAAAQVEKGDVGLSFGASLGWDRLENPALSQGETSGWSIGGSAAATYFVTPRVDVGGNVAVSYRDGDIFDSFGTSVGPIVNVHFRPSRRIVPLVGVSFGYTYQRSGFDQITLTARGWYGEVRGGSDFFVSRSVAVRFTLNYFHEEIDREQQQFEPFQGLFVTEVRETRDLVRLGVGLAFFLKARG